MKDNAPRGVYPIYPDRTIRRRTYSYRLSVGLKITDTKLMRPIGAPVSSRQPLGSELKLSRLDERGKLWQRTQQLRPNQKTRTRVFEVYQNGENIRIPKNCGIRAYDGYLISPDGFKPESSTTVRDVNPP